MTCEQTPGKQRGPRQHCRCGRAGGPQAVGSLENPAACRGRRSKPARQAHPQLRLTRGCFPQGHQVVPTAPATGPSTSPRSRLRPPRAHGKRAFTRSLRRSISSGRRSKPAGHAHPSLASHTAASPRRATRWRQEPLPRAPQRPRSPRLRPLRGCTEARAITVSLRRPISSARA